jgi:hypothetical protein
MDKPSLDVNLKQLAHLIEKKTAYSKVLTRLEAALSEGEASAYYKNINSSQLATLKLSIEAPGALLPSTETDLELHTRLISSDYIRKVIDCKIILDRHVETFTGLHHTFSNDRTKTATDLQHFYHHHFNEFKIIVEDLFSELRLLDAPLDSDKPDLVKKVLKIEIELKKLTVRDGDVNPELTDPRLAVNKSSLLRKSQDVDLEVLTFNENIKAPFSKLDMEFKKQKYSLAQEFRLISAYSEQTTARPDNHDIDEPEDGGLTSQLTGELDEEGELPKRIMLEISSSTIVSEVSELSHLQKSTIDIAVSRIETTDVVMQHEENNNQDSANESWLMSSLNMSGVVEGGSSTSLPKTPVYRPSSAVLGQGSSTPKTSLHSPVFSEISSFGLEKKVDTSAESYSSSPDEESSARRSANGSMLIVSSEIVCDTIRSHVLEPMLQKISSDFMKVIGLPPPGDEQ